MLKKDELCKKCGDRVRYATGLCKRCYGHFNYHNKSGYIFRKEKPLTRKQINHNAGVIYKKLRFQERRKNAKEKRKNKGSK